MKNSSRGGQSFDLLPVDDAASITIRFSGSLRMLLQKKSNITVGSYVVCSLLLATVAITCSH
jgi:hypothetical protein